MRSASKGRAILTAPSAFIKLVSFSVVSLQFFIWVRYTDFLTDNPYRPHISIAIRQIRGNDDPYGPAFGALRRRISYLRGINGNIP